MRHVNQIVETPRVQGVVETQTVFHTTYDLINKMKINFQANIRHQRRVSDGLLDLNLVLILLYIPVYSCSNKKKVLLGFSFFFFMFIMNL